MIWTVLTILIGIILKFLTSPPSALVGWVLSKFELHPKLDSKNSSITLNGNLLDDEEGNIFIDYFNEAKFLKSNHIFPGNEELFLNPETDIIPFVINVKSGRKKMTFYVYCHKDDDQVDVVKQWKKKVASYSLRSEPLHNFTPSSNINETATGTV